MSKLNLELCYAVVTVSARVRNTHVWCGVVLVLTKPCRTVVNDSPGNTCARKAIDTTCRTVVLYT